MILVVILPRHYNFATLTINLPLANVVAPVAVPVSVNDTLVFELVVNLSDDTPPDTIEVVVLRIIGAPLLNNNGVVAAEAET